MNDGTIRCGFEMKKDKVGIILSDARETCPLCGRPANDLLDPREWTGTGGLLTFRSYGACHRELYLDN